MRRGDNTVHKEPQLVQKAKEYVVSLEGNPRGSATSPGSRALQPVYQLIDRWVGVMPYDYFLVERLTKYLTASPVRTVEVQEVDRGLTAELKLGQSEVGFQDGTKVAARLVMRNTLDHPLIVPVPQFTKPVPGTDAAGLGATGLFYFNGTEMSAWTGPDEFRIVPRLLQPGEEIALTRDIPTGEMTPGTHILKLTYSEPMPRDSDGRVLRSIAAWNGNLFTNAVTLKVVKGKE